MHEQQPGHQLVAGQQRERLVVEASGLVQDVQEPFQPGTVEVRDQPDQLIGALPCHHAPGGAGVQQRVDALAGGVEVGRGAGRVLGHLRGYSAPADWVGVCSISSFLPLPRYMCTPQGRHGSKLRTVRMMSIPLKLARSFSSKIGWSCTASS